MGLKNKSLIGVWLIMAAKIYRRQNLSRSFEDWLYENCGIKRQTSYQLQLQKSEQIDECSPKLMNWGVNVAFF